MQETEEHTRRRNYIWNMVYSLLNAAQSALLLAIVNRTLHEAAAGVFSYAFSVALLFMFIGNYGIRNYQVSDTGEKYAPGQYYAARLVSVALMAGASAAWLAVCGYGREKTLVIAALLLWRAMECVEDVVHGRYQQQGALWIAGWQGTLRLLLSDAAFAVVLLLGGSASTASFALALTSLLATAVLAGVTLPHYGGFVPQYRGGAWLRLLMETFPLFLNYFLITYLSNVPKYAMEYYASDAVQAYFNMLFTPVFVVNLLSTMVFRPLITEMARRLQAGDTGAYRALVRRQSANILMIGATVLVGGWLYGLPVLSFFYGSDLSGFCTALLLLLAGGVCAAFSSFYNVCIVTLRGQSQALWLTLLTAAAAVVIHYGAGGRMTRAGADAVGLVTALAAAYLVAMLLQMALYILLHGWLLRRRHGAGTGAEDGIA